ncbi:hypothetical protein SD81_002360 [Tolypothrix campylonemoides VB511288]|nr:hypothetical protein SD81_002360 [Tolypothrix campylonemoides VB511288]
MAPLAEISYLDKNINLSEKVFRHFQQTKDLVNHSVNSLTQSAKAFGESWKQTATQATSQAVDTVTTNLGQAKASLQERLESTEQVKSTTSAVQTAISSSVVDWFEQHPTLMRLVQIFGWAVNHPIISLVILLFALAIAWSLIKAIGRIIESASLSLLQVPFKLLQAFVKISFLLFTKVSSLAVKQLTDTKTSDNIPTLLPVASPQIHKDKQQRLVEISTRLEEIQKEQNQLLQEAAAILASEKIDVSEKVSEKIDVEVSFKHYADLGVNLDNT